MRYLRLGLALSIIFLFTILPMSDAGANTGSVQGSVNEGGILNLVAPEGSVFDSVTFASYGTPNNYQIGTCHAENSQSIVESLAIGNSSLSISATNDVFGDPCSGTGKRLQIILHYSPVTPEPLSICPPTNLTITDDGSTVTLNWLAPTCGNTQPERYAIFFNASGGGWAIATGNVGDAQALNTTITIGYDLFESLQPSGTEWTFSVRSDNDTLRMYSANSNQVVIVVGLIPEPLPSPSPSETATPTPEPSPSPEPTPTEVEPQPTPQPTPTESATNPQPSPSPSEPQPSPTSESTLPATPTPEPGASPTPQPQPSQEPLPSTPEPTPLPSPLPPAVEPDPIPTPEPTPEPEPSPSPEPSPTPDETPIPEPEPELEPSEPEPTPSPEPESEPLPEITETPEPEQETQIEEPEPEPIIPPSETSEIVDELVDDILEDGNITLADTKEIISALDEDGEITQDEVNDLSEALSADGEFTESERELVGATLIAAADGQAVTVEAILEAGISLEDLPPVTPIEVRQDENGNEVVITAEVAIALELLASPSEILSAIFESPAQLIFALGNLGADMSVEEREEATKTIIAATIVGNIATTAAMTASVGAVGYRRNP
jgi:hypothetical protein